MGKLLTVSKIYIGLFILLLSFPGSLLAQSPISAGDLLGQIGTTQVVLDDRSFSIPVNVGLPGPNRIWDFRAQVIGDSLFSVNEFLSPAAIPNSFPQANLVQKIYDPALPTFEFFVFYNVTSNLFISVGDSAHTVTPFDTSFVFSKNDTLAPLPIAFNNTWMTYERDTTGLFPLTANISIDTTENTVDGWGTVRLPLGDFECLRLRQDVKVINQTILNGVVFSTSTDTYIQYSWIARDLFTVARAQSQNGNTDPNFTDATGFARLDSVSPTTGVEKDELTHVPAGFELLQNYPNPFNPKTTITYELPEVSEVSLIVYNLQGKLVRNLVSTSLPAGSYTVDWDGRNDNGLQMASGSYLLKMSAGSFIQTRQLVLMK